VLHHHHARDKLGPTNRSVRLGTAADGVNAVTERKPAVAADLELCQNIETDGADPEWPL
jgi:hypothetical protein